MTSLLSPRRTVGSVSLEATEPALELTVPIEDQPQLPVVGWVLLAIGGAFVTAGASWVLTTGLTVLGWLSAEPGTLTQAVGVGTEFWLLANGAGARIGDTTVTVLPWGITLLIAFTASRCAAFVTRSVPMSPRSAGWAVPALLTVGYLVLVGCVAMLLAGPEPALRAAALMTPLVGAASVWGHLRARDQSLTDWLPGPLRSVPRAVVAAQLVMLAGGAALLVSALVVQLGRVESLQAALQTGPVGGIALVCAQLAVAPNAIVWAASYALGAGFAFGPLTVVAPAGTELGLLPALPLLGALPAAGPGDISQLWWLATGVAAGAVAATVVVLARPAARVDEASLVGGLSGVLAGLVFTGAAWLSGGDLGDARLADLGPRIGPLLVMATSTLGLSGVLTGLVLGLRRLLARRPS